MRTRSSRERFDRSSRVASSACASKRFSPEGRRIAGRDHPPPRFRGHLPITDSGEVVMVRQYRHAIGRWAWELPGGSLNADESVTEAAQRECHEETGLIPTHLDPLWLFSDSRLLRRGDAFLQGDSPAPPGRRYRGSASGRRRRHRGATVQRARSFSAWSQKGEVIDLKTLAGLSMLA